MTAPIVAAYYALLIGLALYGAHRLVLLAILARTRPTPPAPEPESWPRVTVQLPVYNELYVAPRLLAAAAALAYPKDRLEIQVLDDSTDATSAHLAAQVEALRARGLDVHHLHRHDREGYKAGALAAGLRRARGELVAVFDADFVPGPDFLRRAVGHFSDPTVGMVQARWGHINRDSSLLTQAQAVLLDGHFLVEHDARARSGRFFNFNGTAGIWRREAIDDAGDWQHDTLTEDLDLSYRAQLAGWRFVFRPDLVAPAELPVTLSAFKGQQHRWTKGSVQTLRKLGGRLMKAPLPLKVRLEAAVHLTSNLCYVLLVALAALFFPAMWLRAQSATSVQVLSADLLILLASTGAVGAFYLVSQRRAGQGLLKPLLRLPIVMALGTGLALHNGLAAIAGWFQRGGVFVRTPKVRDEGGRRLGNGYVARTSISTVFEIVLGLYLLACLSAAVALGMWWSVPFLTLFSGGTSWVAFGSAFEALSRSRKPERLDAALPEAARAA